MSTVLPSGSVAGALAILMNPYYMRTVLSEETHERLKWIKNEHERKVAVLLTDIGLDFVDYDVKIFEPPEPVIGEIDLAFESGNTLILVEVSAGRNSISDKQWAFFSKWANDQAIEKLREKIGKQSHAITRIHFHLRPPPSNMGGPEAVGVARPGSGNMICYKDDFDRLASMVEHGGVIKDNFVQALADDPDSSSDARRKLGINIGLGMSDH